jgi:hypothetical protein
MTPPRGRADHDCESVTALCERCRLRQRNRREARTGRHALGCKGRHCSSLTGRYA